MTQTPRPPVPPPPKVPRPPAPPKIPRSPGNSGELAVATQQTAPSLPQLAEPIASGAAGSPRGPGPTEGHPTLKEIVVRANEEGISDIHIGVNEEPRFRQRGDIASAGYPVTDLNTFMSWLR
ncbi:MAG: type IV pili twitching motility protein PilT, partial [Cyanobacteriota bacterium]|nr:type IV pili twitching motility protein PilT [Cyanobacteriota bacterium]